MGPCFLFGFYLNFWMILKVEKVTIFLFRLVVFPLHCFQTRFLPLKAEDLSLVGKTIGYLANFGFGVKTVNQIHPISGSNFLDFEPTS